jgi:hypothetical protein
MDLLLQRRSSSDGCTLGQLFVDGRAQCFTLEDVVRAGPKLAGMTAIPFGRYRVVITKSQRFGRMLPLLLEVPSFTGVRIHCGNMAADTEGCILVGQTPISASAIGSSRLALDALLPQIADALARGDEVWLTVERADGAALKV